jgi:rhodanese-related sulfurtransferase
MNITVQELKRRLSEGDKITLIDVREPHEHQEFNIGGKLIPLGNIPASIEDLLPHQDDEIVMYCRSGQRSGMAQQFLMQAGFKNVLNLEGGMLAYASDNGDG